MWHLHFVEQDAILEFAGVPHHHAISSDHVFAHVATTADPTILSNPGRSLQHRALLNDCSSADKDMITDERLAHQLAQDRWLQAKLQIARNLFERVPDMTLLFEQLRMGRAFEVKIIRWRKHGDDAQRMSESFATCERIFSGERTRLACWFWRLAETNFCEKANFQILYGVRESPRSRDALANTRDACAPQIRTLRAA